MERVYERLMQFLADEDGPTAVEYAVLLALIILVVFAAVQSLGSAASKSFEKVVF